ncbi:MAG: helix-hairpin-helix domain-containing protein [Spirochaetes bacterium]|nr:helix-hairpin-helix domain-containing protein [Spirochaetota bacterium]
MMTIALTLYIAAITAFEYRETPPAALFPFCQAASDAYLPDTIPNPAYLPLIRYPYLHFSGGMPYSLGDLYSSSLRIGYGTRGFAAQAVWDRFGFGEYLENVAEANIAYMPLKYVSIGGGVRYFNISIDTVEASLSENLVDGRASIVIAPVEWLNLAFQQDNIGSLFIKKRMDLLYPEWSAGAALRPFRGFSIIYNITATSAGYVNTISASANLLKYLSIRVGYAREAATCSAAFSIMYRYIAASYGIKYHPHLGITHSVSVTLSPFDMNIESLAYGKLFARTGSSGKYRPVDINSCGYEALAEIPGLDRQFADRIMKYRATIGPLSRKSLIQIGMTEKEADRLAERVTGIAPDDAAPRDSVLNARNLEKVRKLLFVKLVSIGLPPASALEAAEMAAVGQNRRLGNLLDSIPDLDAEKKKKVMALCGGSH